MVAVPEGCKHKDGRDEGNQRGSVTCSIHLPQNGVIRDLKHRTKWGNVIELFPEKYLCFIKRYYTEIASLFNLIFVILEAYSSYTSTNFYVDCS